MIDNYKLGMQRIGTGTDFAACSANLKTGYPAIFFAYTVADYFWRKIHLNPTKLYGNW